MVDIRTNRTEVHMPESEGAGVIQPELNIAVLEFYVANNLSVRPVIPAWALEQNLGQAQTNSEGSERKQLSDDEAAELDAYETGVIQHAEHVKLAGAKIAFFSNGLLQYEKTDANGQSYDPTWGSKFMIPTFKALSGERERGTQGMAGFAESYRLIQREPGAALYPWFAYAAELQRTVTGENVPPKEQFGPEYAGRISAREIIIPHQNPLVTILAIHKLKNSPLKDELLRRVSAQTTSSGLQFLAA